MFPNAKGSELISVLATLDPTSQVVGTVSTGWISAGNHHNLLVLVQSGVLGTGATLDAKIQQATDVSGSGVKDLPGKSIVQLTQAGNSSAKQALINLRPEDLDVNNGYAFIRLSSTVGVAASLTAAQVLGLNPRFAPGEVNNQPAVVQVV